MQSEYISLLYKSKDLLIIFSTLKTINKNESITNINNLINKKINPII